MTSVIPKQNFQVSEEHPISSVRRQLTVPRRSGGVPSVGLDDYLNFENPAKKGEIRL